MQAENADLRRIENRRAHQRSEHAAVGDGEGTALEIFERQRTVLRALGEVANRQLDLGEAAQIGVANDGHDEPAFDADRHADVVVVLQTISSPWISAFSCGNALSAPIAALTKKDAIPRPTPCCFVKRFFPSLAQAP